MFHFLFFFLITYYRVARRKGLSDAILCSDGTIGLSPKKLNRTVPLVRLLRPVKDM